MSFLNKVFASVGIGSANVDTRLKRDTFVPGDVIEGLVAIKGGKVEQNIDDIYLSLNTTYLKESDDKKYTVSACIERFRVSEPFIIAANEVKEIPFSFRLPEDTPVTLGRSKIWLATGLDIKNAVDPTDTDYLKVLPTDLMTSVFQAVQDLGFRLREADCEEAPHRMRRRLPFVQEFEFVPVSGQFRGRLDELEIVFFPGGNGSTDIVLQVDRRARGLGGFLAEALERDETNVRLSVSSADIPYIRQKIENVIGKYA